MSYKLKISQCSVKGQDGNYRDFDILAEQTKAGLVEELQRVGLEKLNAINSSGSEYLEDINDAGDEQVARVTAKGAETLNSIPEDYTELSGEVDELKSALEITTNYAIDGDLLISSSFIEQGGISGTGAETTSNIRVRTRDYIPVKKGSSFVFTAGTVIRSLYWHFYTSNWFSVLMYPFPSAFASAHLKLQIK